MDFPVAFYVVEKGKELFLARDSSDKLIFENDMFLANIVQAQSLEEVMQVRAEYEEFESPLKLSTRPFPI